MSGRIEVCDARYSPFSRSLTNSLGLHMLTGNSFTKNRSPLYFAENNSISLQIQRNDLEVWQISSSLMYGEQPCTRLHIQFTQPSHSQPGTQPT